MTTCDHVRDQLSELADGDRDAIARHAAHLAGCDACRDARHEATRLAAWVAEAGADHTPDDDLVARVLAAADRDAASAAHASVAAASSHAAPNAQVDHAASVAAASTHDAPNAQLDHAASVAAASTHDAPNAGLGHAASVAAASTHDAPNAGLGHAASVAVASTHDAGAAASSAAAGDRTVATSERTGASHAANGPAAATARAEARSATARAPETRVAWNGRGGGRGRVRGRTWLAIGASAALVAGVIGIVARDAADPAPTAAAGPIGRVASVERAAADAAGGAGIAIRAGAQWLPLGKDAAIPAGAELRTDERTRAAIELAGGTRLVLDHRTAIALDGDARTIRLAAGRIAADAAGDDGLAAIATPTGRIEITGAPRLSVTATEALTAVQVTRGAVVLATTRGARDEVRAGEEGVIEGDALQVSAAPGLAHEAAWAELAPPAKSDDAGAGIGALRAYKPGETRDRDWNLALARHDVKIRVVGPIARTEVTETFRNDSATTLEGVYQFPLPPDAQIDSLALDVDGGFVDGAFVDKERGAKIWRGVIDKATPRSIARPSQEIIWVEGRWRDPALLDWKRGGRFELRVYPIPAHGARTIKLAYTQVVAPRGAWRQYSYPLPHSRDGSTVADQFTVDVELRGAEPGRVRTAGYDLVADPARPDVNGLTLRQTGFVPRGDLVIDYRAGDGDAELRAWTFAGGAAAAPDDKLAARQRVGIDPRVVAAQRAIAADPRPTAVLALRPKLPRWRDSAPRDYMIVVDGSQSMVGERFTRASELATALVAQMDRRDRFNLAVCDSECRAMGELRAPSLAAADAATRWLAAQTPAGASDVVAALREASTTLGRAADREPWILYIGDGFASTGFRRVGDIERAIAGSIAGARIAAIGIGSDADAAVLQAAARGGGGSYLAWLPGQRATTAAAAALASTMGASLRDAVVELPAGLTDAAPAVLPTVRAGDEVLIAARMTGDVAGDVIVRGSVAGQPFEQRYPLALAVSSAAGNGFVPRLWARLAIDELERTGADRTRIVALSQGYGVMSRETSLLVLESQAMFDAFGVDRTRPAALWTGEDALDEVATSGAIAHGRGALGGGQGGDQGGGQGGDKTRAALDDDLAMYAGKPVMTLQPYASTPAAPPVRRSTHSAKKPGLAKKDAPAERTRDGRPGADWVQLRRVWVRVPSVAPYDGPSRGLAAAITAADAALVAGPDKRENYRALVQALAFAGEIERARGIAQTWRERDQLDPDALAAHADLLGRGGQRELALRTLAGLVDLDADRAALHDRMARAYEQVGRRAQACGHRIALAALQHTTAAGAGAVRCLRALGRDGDAQLIAGAAPDDAARAAIEKAALNASIAPALAGDLVIKARWDAPVDLDVALISPDGTRISWMGGRGDAITADAASRDREELAVRALRRGNYLVEITRGDAATGPVRGTIEIAALGARRAIPFELTGARVVAGRVAVRLEERFEDLDGTPVQLYNGPGRRIIPDRR